MENEVKNDLPKDVNEINLSEETVAKEIEEDKTLNSDELTQLEIDTKVYMEENNATKEEAKEICENNIEEIRRIKKLTDDKSIFEGVNKDNYSKRLDKKKYINSDLETIKETIKDHNKKKIDEINKSIKDVVDNNSILTNPTSNFKGESSREYQLFIEDLQDRLDVVIKNTEIVESVSKIIDEELITGLEKLEEYNEKREKARTELDQIKRDYIEHIANKAEPLIAKHYTDVNTNIVINCYVTNIEYIDWLNKKLSYEKDIREYIEIIEKFDMTAEETQTQIKKSLEKEKELESQLKEFSEVKTEERT